MISTGAKAFVLAALVAASFSGLSSCDSPSANENADPEATVARMLDTLKADSPSDVAERLSGEDGYMTSVIRDVTELAPDFDYSVGAAVVQGDTAGVEVTVTTYPFGEVFERTMQDLLTSIAQKMVAGEMAEISSAASSGAEITDEYVRGLEEKAIAEFDSEAESAPYGEAFAARFSENVAEVGKTRTRAFTVTLRGAPGEAWRADEFTEDSGVTDAIYGGIIEAASELNRTSTDEMFIRIYTDEVEASYAKLAR